MTTLQDTFNQNISPEQRAIWNESQRTWTLGLEAGEAGEPMPEGAALMAYKSGVARRRCRAGEIIGYEMRACKCGLCGESNYEWRLGCRCWTADGELNPKASMTYGYQVQEGSDPDDQASRFMSSERLLELQGSGREVYDVMTGEFLPPLPSVA